MFINGNLGINPIEKLMDNLGEMGLRLLIVTLIFSMLSQVKHFRAVQNIRRIIGLLAFYYICFHFLAYIVLDHFFNWDFIIKDIYKRPFITLGFFAFLFLIPLAITSNNISMRKFSYKIWKRIHKLIYLALPLAGLHYFLLTKADKREPLVYLIIIFFFLILRFYYFLKKLSSPK
tara:strand:+ start:156 stop:680 length:525 start_codon:yes stop_codon:yes gene_type:complete